jgi:hypothetical protein
MRSAPRRCENAIAEIISKKSDALGLSQVYRLPVTGRTGPDISINELNLVIDVKNRLEVPKGYFHSGLTTFGNLVGVPISEMELMLGEPTEEGPISKIVTAWFDHMDEWRLKYNKKGITALVLHRPNQTPKMPFGKSVLLISNTQKEYFAQCLQIVTQS